MGTIAVCVKQIGSLADDVEFLDDGLRVDPDYLDLALNEWDACAMEEALRLREAAGAGDVVVVTVGDEEAEDVLVRCLAMGADRAIRVDCATARDLDALAVARALAAAIEPLQPELVLCGAQSSDAGQGCTGPALAAVLGLPCVAVATRVAAAAPGTLVAHRELEGGLVDVVEVDLPAVVTVQTGINEPRYVTLRAIHQAQEAEIDVVPSSETGPRGYRVRGLARPARERAAPLGSDARSAAAAIAEIVRSAAR